MSDQIGSMSDCDNYGYFRNCVMVSDVSFLLLRGKQLKSTKPPATPCTPPTPTMALSLLSQACHRNEMTMTIVKCNAKLSICQSYRWEMLRRQQAPRSYVLWYQDMYNHARHHVRSCTCFLGIFRFNQSQRCCACWLCEAWQPTGPGNGCSGFSSCGLHFWAACRHPRYPLISSLIILDKDSSKSSLHLGVISQFTLLFTSRRQDTPSWDKLLGPTNVLRTLRDIRWPPKYCVLLHFLWTFRAKWSWSWAYCSGSMSCYCKHPHHHAMQKRSWQLKRLRAGWVHKVHAPSTNEYTVYTNTYIYAVYKQLQLHTKYKQYQTIIFSFPWSYFFIIISISISFISSWSSSLSSLSSFDTVGHIALPTLYIKKAQVMAYCVPSRHGIGKCMKMIENVNYIRSGSRVRIFLSL